MNAIPRILVEPGNPFGFDPGEFAELVDAVREELSPEYDVLVAYREQVGAAVTLYEVVDFWLSWQSWSTAAQSILLEKLLDRALEWRRRRRKKEPATIPFRPFSARVIVAAGKTMVVGEVRIGDSGGEPEYGPPFSDNEEGRADLRNGPPPVRPWPPVKGDLPQRPSMELANRRVMLEGIHAVVKEAQRQGRESVVLDSAILAGIGTPMGLNATESKGLFKRLLEGNFVRLRDPLGNHLESDELRAEVEYLTDRGLREIGEL